MGDIIKYYVWEWLYGYHSSSNFIEEYGELSLIEEDVIFGLVANERAEIFAYYAMPISSIFFIEFFFDMFRHKVLNLQVIDCIFGLSFIVITSLMA